jgi:D-serine deaminase-like pyridoxal phosphate-dependent protein
MPMSFPSRGADESGWYRSMARAVREAGVGEPALLIDLDRLDANIEQLRSAVPPGRSVRLVQKSLPSLPLIEYVVPRLGVRGLMMFHRPFLNVYAQRAPRHDQLLGKPMPVAAAHAFYEAWRPGCGFDPSTQLQWLVDTEARLAQYLALARTKRLCLQVNLEIDVGLRRGGVPAPEALAPLLALVAANPQHLRWSGFMGYDSHAVQAPPWSSPLQAVARSNARHRGFIAWAQAHHPALFHDRLCFNGAGSPTVTLHSVDTPLTELALGSALVKPTDFDVPSLAMLRPAALIATPVLKVLPHLELPFIEPLARLAGRLLPGRGQSVFVYGGRMMARPVWPPGLRSNRLYGLSSNQQLLNLPAGVPVAVDDSVLWRPTQSEAVLLQFGDLLGVRGGRVVERFAADPLVAGLQEDSAPRLAEAVQA